MEKSKTISIVHEATDFEPFVILDKPRGLPSAPLVSGEDSALTQCARLYPDVKRVFGKKEIEYGLLHRIDTETEGLLLICLTQEFYDKMLCVQNCDGFKKEYTAVCKKNLECKQEGFPPFNADFSAENTCSLNAVISSKFRAFGKKGALVRPVSSDSGKAALKAATNREYKTNVSIELLEKNMLKASCSLTRGFRHQVRCHLAWASMPIVGDRLYNPKFKESDYFCFWATGLSFINPITDKLFKISKHVAY